MAAETLAARGYRHLGFLGGPERASTTEDRFAGFAATAAAQGLTVRTGYAGTYSFEAGRAEMQSQLRLGNLPEAWFCADDVLSIGALSALVDAGLQVPDDVGLIGLNDMEMAGWANIGLTTIHQPFQAIIESSVEMVEANIRGEDRAPEVRLFPCRIVERQTLRPLA
jgi:DNA-binding LacI/PurR family transcriptional regulator